MKAGEAVVAAAARGIELADAVAYADARRELDRKTKPRGRLGELEELACRVAAIRPGIANQPRAALLLAAGDHGVAAEGVSAYPQAVTAQMLRNFVSGGAAVNVLAREADAELVVVDAGVCEPVHDVAIRALRLGPGTANISTGPAMSREQAIAGLAAGVELVDELAGGGVELVALGDMGIGNTTSAAALTAALLPADPASTCGPGSGLDAMSLARKVDVVRRSLAVNRASGTDPVDALARVGGFELAVLAGACVKAAARRIPIVLDGFITAAAALVAVRMAPAARDAMIAAHRSPEPGHTLVLQELGLAPLLDLGLRLGEGSGAALALPLVRAAIALLREMATFESAGVSDAGV